MNITAINGYNLDFGKKPKYHGGKLHKEFLKTSTKTNRYHTHNKNDRIGDNFRREIKTIYNSTDDAIDVLEKEVDALTHKYMNAMSGLDINSKKVRSPKFKKY